MPDSAIKLTFPRFVDLLLYLCLKGIDGLRSLCSELRNNHQNVALADLVVVGVSTISDAFIRYPLIIVQKLYQRLLAQSSLPDIEEFRTLGQLAICDSSRPPHRVLGELPQTCPRAEVTSEFFTQQLFADLFADSQWQAG